MVVIVSHEVVIEAPVDADPPQATNATAAIVLVTGKSTLPFTHSSGKSSLNVPIIHVIHMKTRVFSPKFPHCSHILIYLLAAVNNAFQVNHHPLLCEPFNRRCCGVREKVEGGGVKDAVWSAPFSLSVRALRGEYHTDVYIKHDDHTSVVVERNKSQIQCHHVSIIQFCVDGFKLNLVNQSMMTSRANIAVKSFSLIQRSSITLCVLHLSCMLTTRYNS